MNSKIIKKTVENTFNTKIDTRSRERDLVYIRSIYYKLCRDFTRESLYLIGKNVNRDHATVLHGLKVFDHIIDNFWEKELMDKYLGIKKRIQGKVKIEVKSYDPDKFYRDKYRIKLLQNINMYRFTKNCINILEQREFKYSNKLKKELNDIINDNQY